MSSDGGAPLSPLELDPVVVRSLAESRELGFLGRRPIDEVVTHARFFVEAITPHVTHEAASTLDLGAGGGIPGLVIAHDLPVTRLSMLDRRRTRTDFLTRVVHRLQWSNRVEVLTQDAQRPTPAQRRSFDAVVARGFGPPETTLRIASTWVRTGGVIVISEPPSGDRWSAVDLAAHGVHRLPSSSQVAVFQAS